MLDRIKALLGIEDCLSDAILSHYLQDTIQGVLDYCHIQKLPEPLEPLVCQLVMDRFNSGNSDNISSVKRGDTQISYHSYSMDSFTESHKKRLNQYRKAIVR